MSFGYDEARLYSDYNQWINTIDEIYSKYKKDIDFIPELAFYWGTEPYTAEAIFDEVSSYNYFKSIDLYGNELSASAEEYINLYKMAEHKKYILKAHVGEFGDSESVKNAVQKLNLNQIQHGINSVDSQKVMKLLKDKDIQLNICPSSNIYLKRAS